MEFGFLLQSVEALLNFTKAFYTTRRGESCSAFSARERLRHRDDSGLGKQYAGR